MGSDERTAGVTSAVEEAFLTKSVEVKSSISKIEEKIVYSMGAVQIDNWFS